MHHLSTSPNDTCNSCLGLLLWSRSLAEVSLKGLYASLGAVHFACQHVAAATLGFAIRGRTTLALRIFTTHNAANNAAIGYASTFLNANACWLHSSQSDTIARSCCTDTKSLPCRHRHKCTSRGHAANHTQAACVMPAANSTWEALPGHSRQQYCPVLVASSPENRTHIPNQQKLLHSQHTQEHD